MGQFINNVAYVGIWWEDDNLEHTTPRPIDDTYTPGGFVWGDRPFYLVKWPQEKWACDFRDDATPLSFQLQVTEAFF